MPPYPDHSPLRDAAFEMGPDAQMVVDVTGVLVAANGAARRLFGLTEADLGSPLQDLEISYRPADLRSAIDRARVDRRDISLRAIPWDHGASARYVDVNVVPLVGDDRELIGMRISFTDVTPLKSLQEELTQSKLELETAYEELQSSNEELETTNEELQSTVEELETTNEELQSTNEELETMNEELQSTNEELQTMNDELRNRSVELNSSNAFLEAVFTGLRSAVVVLNRDLRVQVWNKGALDTWGVREDEAVGNSFFTLDIGFPIAELHPPIREILSGAKAQKELTRRATNRRGKSFQCRVSLTPLLGAERTVRGAILLMEEEHDAEETKPSG